ncbi:gp58-like family protein [Streptococcus suis]|nr:gp58-like family protein [Streptococcus suis]MDG3218088.1 gp58-like family protein [Streptococcus suis]
MLAKDRVFAIRAGTYTSSDIKEASFNYGYISGDTFKPGGTVAGSAKLTFTSIITSFNKLDKVYPEIGLKVGDSFEWVAMGEYFVNDINIDRNRNTTELDLMDGMFKLNQPYISDLTYPAQIRDVIREICVKTGVELETDDLGFRAIQHHIQSKADKKDITFREVLSQAIQLLGFSAFFNRKGKLEIRGLIESNITITADNYFLHGLTKSELMYQIAGITCKKDKETLTVGLRTGRSLELENNFMIQNILDDLYYDLKNIRYYPYSLDWQGHLKLDVGQWVTLKTNKNETFKVPVLSQSFNFKGGLKSKISADSKAGNDTQYAYKGFLGKRIEQMSTEIEAEVQQQLEYKDKEFDEKINKVKSEINDGLEQSKAEAEAYADTIKQNIDAEIDAVNQSMQAQSEEHDRQVANILSKNQSVESLANQAKSDAASAIARANQVKTEAIADARAQVATVNQAFNTTKTELQSAIASADQKARDSQASATALRNDLNLQASKILAQAQAQTALTNRVSTVETLADGTRSTVAELSKTVSKATGDIASVTSRTKTVEDTLSQTRTQYEALTQTVNTQTGQIESINRRTADLQSGIDGVTERFENLRVGGRNLIPGTAAFSGTHWEKSGTWRLEESLYKGAGILTWVGGMKGSPIANISVQSGDTYTFSAYIKKENAGTVYFYLYDEHETWFAAANVPRETLIRDVGNNFQRFTITFKVTRSGILKPRFAIIASDTGGFSVAGYQLETGTVATDWTPAPEDIHSEIAIYKRTAEESSAELSRQIQLADGKAVEAKSYAQQTTDAIKTRLESLETYKNGESTRASQYFTASRDETARQITAERTAIANNYVAKSIYDENVRGTTLKLNEIKTTADTAKQNLATYRNTVDRKLEELTSSTQTIDRKINTASTKVDMVAGEIRTELSQVESKIPTEMSGNLILEGNRPWSSTSYLAKEYQLAEPLEEGKTYTFVIHWWRGSGASANYVPMVYYNSSTLQLISPNGTTALQESASRLRYDPNIDSWVATFTVKKRSQMTVEQLQVFDNRPPKLLVYRFGSNVKDQNGGWADTTQSNASFATLVKGNIPLSRWEPAYSELATVTALHNVTDTVKSHTRTIGAVGETGSILDNVSKVAQTAAGLVQEVSGTNGLKTQVGQLKNSWAVKISGPEGLKTAINASEDGIRFKGKNLWLDGNTLIDNAVITSAMIAGLDAGKITTGYLDAARIRVGAIDGSKIAFDEAFFNGLTANQAYLKKLFAKDAFITSVQAVAVSAKQIAGGIAKALNGGMDVNFDESKINFYTNVAAIRRIYTGHPTQFIKFETEGNYSRTIIGSNRNGGEVFNSATFAGVVVENTNNINTEDNVRIYGDSTLLRHAQGDVGWNINSVTQRIVPANMNAESEIWSKHFVAPDKNSKPVRLDTAVAALWDIWNHIIYNNFEFNEALRTHIKARRDNWKFELNL